MGLHKLEIEVTDELLSRIDKVSDETGEDRKQVIVEILSENLPEAHADQHEALIAFQRTWPLVAKSGRNLTIDQIDADVRAFRED